MESIKSFSSSDSLSITKEKDLAAIMLLGTVVEYFYGCQQEDIIFVMMIQQW